MQLCNRGIFAHYHSQTFGLRYTNDKLLEGMVRWAVSSMKKKGDRVVADEGEALEGKQIRIYFFSLIMSK